MQEAEKLLKKVNIKNFKKENTLTYLGLLQGSSAPEYTSAALLQSSIDITKEEDRINNLSPYLPVVESVGSSDAIIEKPLDESTKKLKDLSKSLQVIIGFNKDEGINFANENLGVIHYTDDLLKIFLPKCDKQDQMIQLLKKEYFDNSGSEEQNKTQFVNMVGDAHYIYGIYQTAKEFANAGIPTYFYRFSYEDNYYKSSVYKKIHGVPHGAEYKYLFKPRVGYFGTESEQLNQKDKEVQKKLLTMWKSFAENG